MTSIVRFKQVIKKYTMFSGHNQGAGINRCCARGAAGSKSLRNGMKDPAASSGVSQGIWMMDAASGGESDPSERPEARSPIIQKTWN